MPDYLNDSPIESVADDLYGIAPFAKSLTKSILNIKNPHGTTIAINGPWGSGKSSAVNLIRSELAKNNSDKLVVSDFKCWWYKGEEALALAFLQNLNAVLSDTFGRKVKNLVPNLGRKLLQGGPVLGSAAAMTVGAATVANPLAALAGATVGFAKNFFPEGDTLEKTFQKLAKILKDENRRFLIIIDDIDRLTPDEALAIFRLVKSVGQLPNVMYLLVFDRQLAEKAVADRYPSEGPHFLDKIIQAGFELPPPLQSDLNESVWQSIEQTCGVHLDQQPTHVMNIFYDAVVPYMTTPRHVVRFQNAISVTWPAIAGEVNVGDFLALETIRLYEPSLYQAIRNRKSMLCGVRKDREPVDDNRFDPFLRDVKETDQPTAKKILQRLFPRMQTTGHGYGFLRQWDAERLVCIEAHFDTYFRLSLSETTLSTQNINELIAQAANGRFVQNVFREAVQVSRTSGRTMVPVYLEELITHAARIEKDKVQPLLTALFAIHDAIDMPVDNSDEFFGGTTTIRYHRLIRRLTEKRFSLEERTDLYWQAMQTASLGWLVDFVSSAQGHYREDRKDGPKREEDCLITKTALPKFIALALEKIKTAAQDGTLIRHQDLFYILYRWRDFSSPDKVKAWTDTLMSDDHALVILAIAFTGYSLIHHSGFDGLSDHTSTRKIQAQIDSHIDILDPQSFRSGLERIQAEQTLDASSIATVSNFLAAWDRRVAGEELL